MRSVSKWHTLEAAGDWWVRPPSPWGPHGMRPLLIPAGPTLWDRGLPVGWDPEVLRPATARRWEISCNYKEWNIPCLFPAMVLFQPELWILNCFILSFINNLVQRNFKRQGLSLNHLFTFHTIVICRSCIPPSGGKLTMDKYKTSAIILNSIRSMWITD